MIDTHTHLQFKVFAKMADQVIDEAFLSGMEKIIVVGTNTATSAKAITLAERYNNVFAAVGIHPHHVFEHIHTKNQIETHLDQIERMLASPKVVAVGEIGMDMHDYPNTKYDNYKIDQKFIDTQREFFISQISLAKKYKKSLILHNREASEEFIEILEKFWDKAFENKTVFHYCEPNTKLLEFALNHGIFIGVDGDVTYDKSKQDFIEKVPLEHLVLETDSPFVAPEPLKSQGITLNEPKNLKIIAEFVSQLKKLPIEVLQEKVTKNSLMLFGLK